MSKLHKLRNLLQQNEVDAILVTNPFNRRYITNFTGTAGSALITDREAFFITDFRYVDQANEQAKDFTVVEHHGPISDKISELLDKNGIKLLGFEEEHVTYAQHSLYEEKFSARLIATKGMIESLRIVKSADEIEILKQAAKIADEAYGHILNHLRPGMTEIDIANELEFFMRKKGATSSSFDIIVASGYRSALPHGVASEKKIETGELVTLDYGALYKGYCSDTTRTVAVGEVSDDLKKIYETVQEAQERAVRGIKPGMTGKEADALARDYIVQEGYGDYFGHSTGHGIGLEVHEGPALSLRSHIELQKNMVVTVEPGIYIPEVGGCRIEDDIVLTESGNERLTHATKQFIQV